MAQIFVPDDQATIVAALGAAVTDDEVIVRSGTYNEYPQVGLGNINITLRSETGNPEDVIIDGLNAGRILLLTGTGLVAIRGLTIVNGQSPDGFDGGGILNQNSNPGSFVRDCIIKDCNAPGTGRGGGIASVAGELEIINCLIKGNEAAQGGGVYHEVTVTIAWCTIVDNTSRGVDSGGGVYSTDVESVHYNTIIWDNTALDNNGHQICKIGVVNALNLINCCYENGVNDIAGVITPVNSTTANPKFITAGTRTNLLWQKAAGQATDSPCLDTGNQAASASPVAGMTTRTDAIADEGIVDMGFHWFTGPACVVGPCGAPLGMLKINNMLAQIDCILRNVYAGLIAGLDPDCIVRAIAVDEEGHIILGTLLEEWTTTWPVTMQDAVSVGAAATSALSDVLDLRRARGAAITSHVAFHALAVGDVIIRAYSSTDGVTYSTVPIAEMRAVCNPGNTEVVPMRIGAEFSYVKVTAENLDVAQAAVVTTIGEKKLTQETCD